MKLQITLWDYVRYGVNDFLGETVVDLHNHPLDDEPEWYMLQPHQESNYPGGVRTRDHIILVANRKLSRLKIVLISLLIVELSSSCAFFPIDF